MAYSAEFQERYDLFQSCIKMEKTNRIPNLSNFITWKILDSEHTVSDAFSDFSIMEKVVREFHERYQFDAYMDLGIRNSIGPSRAFGGGNYSIDNETGAINFVDAVIMNEDEYPEYRKNPTAFFWKMFLRKYPQATNGQVVNAVAENLKFGQYAVGITQKFATEYHCPSVINFGAYPSLPIENFINYYRGIKGCSMDMRRRKGELKETLDFVFETETMPIIERIASQPGSSAYICDASVAILAHSVMNRKQFEELYWPYLKILLDKCAENNRTIYLYCESSIARFIDFFQEIPKNTAVVHLELDDPFEIRKALPNVCIAGGMKAELLGKGTKEECVDYAKKLLDGMGPGFIFSQDKMMSFKFDCKRENLLAVNEVVRNYRV